MDTSGQPLGVTARIVDWRLEPHPLVPSEGDRVHFHYRFDGADKKSGPGVDACAVDEKPVVLRCQTVYSSDAWPEPDGALTGDDWLEAVEREEARCGLLLPRSGRDCVNTGRRRTRALSPRYERNPRNYLRRFRRRRLCRFLARRWAAADV
ncbi:hypothetical protein [Streptomyces cyslabdanicus]|uniref:hypothetical protein n=1 Tax=Streptomyces cyslabdanicus TaxID=1470456 RepID=UPI0040448A33